jgi:hypothetical protein
MAQYNNRSIKAIEETVSCICGHCSHNVAMQIFSSTSYLINIQGFGTKLEYEYKIGWCSLCGKPSLYNVKSNKWLPQSKPYDDVKFLPPDIQSLYDEIRNSYATSAFSCSIMASRKLIMHIAVNLGATPGDNFKNYVNFLDKNNYTPKNSSGWIDKIRDAGNEQNHELIIASKDDADRILKFVQSLLKIVYELPNSF